MLVSDAPYLERDRERRRGKMVVQIAGPDGTIRTIVTSSVPVFRWVGFMLAAMSVAVLATSIWSVTRAAVVLDNGDVLVVGGDVPRRETREAELIGGRTSVAFTTSAAAKAEHAALASAEVFE